jgi:tryptophan synthase alpha chain
MNRISQKLQLLSNRGEKALSCFITAGFPTLGATVPFVLEIEKAGADIIELGMPFSDPLADGPLIQHSSQVALSQGIILDKILTYVRTIRRHSEIPIVLMGYLNPILRYGAEKFFDTAASAGVDGVILPELPFEESDRYKSLLEHIGLANILLVTPTTPSDRVALIDKASSGFLYCVSTIGVTGLARNLLSDSYIKTVKKFARRNPVLVGFGIKTPADVKRMARHADGVIVGSALIQRITQGKSAKQLGGWVRRLKDAL